MFTPPSTGRELFFDGLCGKNENSLPGKTENPLTGPERTQKFTYKSFREYKNSLIRFSGTQIIHLTYEKNGIK